VPNVADRAAGYGIPGLIADGTDVLDVYAKTKEAADHARSGRGPSIVEVKCYRYQPHSSDDDDSRYRSKDLLKEWQAKDPVDKGRDYLRAQGVGQPALDAMRVEIAAEIERSIDEAEADPDPRAEDLLEHVYAKEGIPGGTRA